MAHPIENIMKTTMEELKGMVDVNTIVGDPIMTGGDTVIVPVSKVSLGFLSGGGEYCAGKERMKSGGGRQKNNGGAHDGGCDCEDGDDHRGADKHPFIGTSVAGANVTPMAFLAISGGVVRVLPAHYTCTLDRIIEAAPEAIRALEKAVGEMCATRNRAPRGAARGCGHDDDAPEYDDKRHGE
ncbi:MAG: GerW family sporulation protein [Clostridiales bacterium]|jgi:sporulation protein YtfJ|nr:GerW family sporulation protein [Clostridiales bacterium]